jgi:hypothetical protein
VPFFVCRQANGFPIELGAPWFSVVVLGDLEKLFGAESLADKEKAPEAALFYHYESSISDLPGLPRDCTCKAGANFSYLNGASPILMRSSLVGAYLSADARHASSIAPYFRSVDI